MDLIPHFHLKALGQGRSVTNTVAVAAGFGMLLLGYDQGVMAGLIGGTGTPFSMTFDNPDATTLGLMVAIYEIGCFAGAVVMLFFGESCSRRTWMVAGVVVMAIGAVLQTVALNMSHLIAGRIVTGLGNGINFSAIPVWVAEISGHEQRGRVAAFNGWLIIWGVVIAYWTDYGCAHYTNDMQFRFPIALQILFGLIMAVMVLFLPESPRWLIAHGRREKARDVLNLITPTSKLSSDEPASHQDRESIRREQADKLFEQIVATYEVEQESEGKFTMLEMFHGGRMQNWRRMALCVAVMAFQQLSGINLLTYYISYVLEHSVGLDHRLSLLIGGFNGLEYLVAAAIPMWTIERFGRRKLLLLSASGQACAMTVLAGTIWYVTEKQGPANFAMGILAVVCFFVFNTFYAQGFLAIPFFYPAEITNLRTRSRGVALSVMSNWIFTFMVVMITPISTTNIGWRTYLIFACLNFSFIPFIYLFFPETARLSLEAIDAIFDCNGVTRGVLNKEHRQRMLLLPDDTETATRMDHESVDVKNKNEVFSVEYA